MPRAGPKAFTLLELLIVFAIIGLLATMGLPALRGLTQTNATATANRQLLDDLGAARLRAINNRSTLYVVFLSPEVLKVNLAALDVGTRRSFTNTLKGMYSSYAFYSERTLGDQPGFGQTNYLTDWVLLPEGVFFDTNKFRLMDVGTWQNTTNATNRPFAQRLFPFPEITNSLVMLPYIAFDYQGRLLSKRNDAVIPLRRNEEIIPLTKGTVLFDKDANGQLVLAPPEVIEMPKKNSVNTPNRIHIDHLTGRARVVLPQLPP